MTITEDDFWFLNFVVAGGGKIDVPELISALAPEHRERFKQMLPSLVDREIIDLSSTDAEHLSAKIYPGKISITQAGYNAFKDFKRQREER